MAFPKGADNPNYSGGYGTERTPEYNSWASMIQRCTNPTHPDYARYGGRGITVCVRWEVFSCFLEDMGQRPRLMSLDRYPDQDGNYEPSNCRWANQTQQMRNMSRNVHTTIDGITKLRIEWCEDYKISEYVVRRRIQTGWDPVDAIIAPLYSKRKVLL